LLPVPHCLLAVGAFIMFRGIKELLAFYRSDQRSSKLPLVVKREIALGKANVKELVAVLMAE